MGLFGFGKKEKDKMKDGLEKTRTGFWGNILNTLTGSKIDDDLYDELEEQLILADVGGEVAVKLVDKLRDRVKEKGLKTGEEAADQLRELIADEMRPEAEMELDGHPAVILVIGVNGVGKTTSIAKLADHYTRQGRRVMLAAGDTFRAAASEQLEIWADRAGVPLVKAGEGADPAAVIFDTVKSATGSRLRHGHRRHGGLRLSNLGILTFEHQVFAKGQGEDAERHIPSRQIGRDLRGHHSGVGACHIQVNIKVRRQ